MAKYRMVRTSFWENPIVIEEMTQEEMLFYLYLLTNPRTTQIGIYRITKRKMAFDLKCSVEIIQSIMERFIEEYKLIRYNSETRELAIKYWGKDNLHKGGKPIMDCIFSELKEVEDTSLISYVLESIQKQEIRSLYESFCESEDCGENDIDKDSEYGEVDDTSVSCKTSRGQKQKEEEKEKQQQKQQQKAFYSNIENHSYIEDHSQSQKTNDAKELVEFWDNNGFGFSNVNAKERLLAWLDHSSFLQPKDVILKAMSIACANNKRKLNYVLGILKNWESESLLTVEEIDAYQENQKHRHNQSPESIPAGRDIPRGVDLDITAGEDW